MSSLRLGPGLRLRQFLGGSLLAWALVLAGVWRLPEVTAAVDEPVVVRLRQAVRLPRMNVQLQFGFIDSQDWLSEPEVKDPSAELAQLRGRLQGELADARVLSEIARITALQGEAGPTQQARAAATAAWRKWATTAPNDRAVQTGFATALRLDKEYAEAERRLRALIAEGDTSYEAAYELASVLGELGLRPLWMASGGRPGPLVGGPPASAEVVEQGTRMVDEAVRIADRLVQQDPSDPRGWARRARLQTNRGLLELGRAPDGKAEEKEKMRRMYAALFPAAARSDVSSAARLRPKDSRLIMARVLHELGGDLIDLLAAMATSSSGEAFARLGGSQQTVAREALAQLDRLGEDEDWAVAGSALEYDALLRIMLQGDRTAAARLAARALRLAPSRQQAFDTMLSSIASSDKPDWGLAEEAIRERLKVKDDPRTRFALMKVVHESGRVEAALEVVHGARKTFAGNGPLEVAHFALHLKLGHYPNGPEGNPDLAAIGKALDQLPDGDDKLQLIRNYYVTGSILAGLTEEPMAARQMLGKYLAQVPDDDYGKAVFELLQQLR